MKTASRVRKTDVKRTIEAVRATGVEVSRIEIDTMSGKIIVIVGKAEPAPQSALEEWKNRRAGKAQGNREGNGSAR